MRKQKCESNNEIIKTGDKSEAGGKQFVSMKPHGFVGMMLQRLFYDFLQSFPQAGAGGRSLGEESE